LKAGSEIETAEIADQLAGMLPSYAVPAKVVIRDDFPRTSTGKIDRRKLQSQALVHQSE
jgi:acyl-CoA synthetase (AMP-forming)/AMP-acid ligase II